MNITTTSHLVDRSLTAFINHDFLKEKTTHLALAVFTKHGKPYLKEVDVSNPLKRWWWKKNIREVLPYLENQIRREQKEKCSSPHWLDRTNITLKKQYAVLARKYPGTMFRSSLFREKLKIRVIYPYVDKNSTAIHPKLRRITIASLVFDELTPAKKIAKSIKKRLYFIPTETYGERERLRRTFFRMSKHSSKLYDALKTERGTLAEFLRKRKNPNVLDFVFDHFHLSKLEKLVEERGKKDGDQLGYSLGITGKASPKNPAFTKEDAAKFAFGLDHYFNAFKKEMKHGYQDGRVDFKKLHKNKTYFVPPPPGYTYGSKSRHGKTYNYFYFRGRGQR